MKTLNEQQKAEVMIEESFNGGYWDNREKIVGDKTIEDCPVLSFKLKNAVDKLIRTSVY